MSPKAPISMADGIWALGFGICQSYESRIPNPKSRSPASRRRRRRYQQVLFVPHEIVFAVDGELVVLAHEDGADRTRFLAVSAEDAARLVNLVDGRVAGPGLDRSVVLGGFEIDRIGRTGDGTQPAGDALFETVLVAHQHLLAAVPRVHRELLLRVGHRDRF